MKKGDIFFILFNRGFKNLHQDKKGAFKSQVVLQREVWSFYWGTRKKG